MGYSALVLQQRPALLPECHDRLQGQEGASDCHRRGMSHAFRPAPNGGLTHRTVPWVLGLAGRLVAPTLRGPRAPRRGRHFRQLVVQLSLASRQVPSTGPAHLIMAHSAPCSPSVARFGVVTVQSRSPLSRYLFHGYRVC